jgi:hypothetical protein
MKKNSIDILSRLEPENKRENHSHSYPAPRVSLANKRQKPHKRQSPHQLPSKQLNLWEPLQAKEEESPYLQITSVPVNARINPNEVRYILVILPHGIRAAAGQYTAEEAHAIAQKTKGWSWNLDADGRLQCLSQLEALLDTICKHSFEKERGEIHLKSPCCCGGTLAKTGAGRRPKEVSLHCAQCRKFVAWVMSSDLKLDQIK